MAYALTFPLTSCREAQLHKDNVVIIWSIITTYSIWTTTNNKIG